MKKEDIPEELINNFKNNLGAFFVGSGLSVDSGYPSWSGLLSEMISMAKEKSWINEEKIHDFEELSEDFTKFLFLAEELKIELGSSFDRFLENRFSQEGHNPTQAHKYLVDIKSSLIITLNYDDLIERAYNEVFGTYPNSFTYDEPRKAANNFWKNYFFILKAHGDVKKDVKSLILSQRDYRSTLYRESGYKSLLQSIFSSKAILFVGVSLADPEFNQLLDYLHDSYHGGGPTHYLLIEKEKNQRIMERRYLDDFNIETIPFENPDGSFSEVTEFLRILNEESPRN